MKVYILEDEQLNQDLLKRMIQNLFPQFEIVGVASNLDEAVRDFDQKEIDLAFLDIKLQGDNVFDLLNQIDVDFKIIFTTAYSEYAIDAFKHNAIDYLLKPFEESELIASVQKATTQPEKNSGSIKDLARQLVTQDKALIHVASGFRFVNSASILYLKADKVYTDVHLDDGQVIKSSKGLNHYTDHMGPSFIRVHHSFMVNLEHVVEYNSKDLLITLSNGEKVNVSVRKKADFLARVKAVAN